MKKIIISWLPVLSWAGVIYLFSSRPVVPTSEIYWQDFVVKKLAHVIEYGIFAILTYRGLKMSGMEKKKAGYWAILFALIYGASDEFHQSFTPGREPRIRDVAFDTIGACLGIYALWNILPKAPNKLVNLARALALV